MKKTNRIVSLILAIVMTLTLMLPIGMVNLGALAASPSSDYVNMSVASDGTPSNTVSGGPTIVSRGTGTALYGQDKVSKKYYLSVDPTQSKAYYAINDVNTYYLKYYNDSKNYASTKTSFTWEILVNLPVMPSTTATYIDVMGYNASGGFSFAANNQNGAMVFCAYDGTSKSYIKFPFAMTTGKWYHVVLTYDAVNKVVSSYVNGEAVKTDGGETSATVAGIGYSYIWQNGLQIGAGHLENKEAKYALNLGKLSFSMFAVSSSDAASLYADTEAEWKLSTAVAPTPNYFKLDLSGTPKNGVSGGKALKVVGSGAPVVTDPVSGRKYLNNIKNATDLYKMDTDPYFLKFYHNYNSGATNDLTFTWEFTVNMVELPASTQTAYTTMLGYAEDGGFSFGVSGTKGAEGALIIYTGPYYGIKGSSRTALTMPFALNIDEWYHCILTYNDSTKTATGYVNGVKIGEVDVEQFSMSYNWTPGAQIGGGHNGSTKVPLSNKISMFNFSTYAVSYKEAVAMYEASIIEKPIDVVDGTSNVKAFSAAIDDKIDVDMYISLSDYPTTDKLSIKINGTEGTKTSIASIPCGELYSGSGDLYKLSSEFSAKELANSITVIGYNSSDEKLFETAEYSVAKYCESIINADAYDRETIALCKAILNYGAAAQTYFGYNGSSLANKNLSKWAKMYDAREDFSAYAPSVTGTGTLKYYGASVALESEVALNFYFTMPKNASLSDYTFKVDGDTVSATEVNSGDSSFKYARVTVADVSADKYDHEYTITADGITVKYSVYSYVNSVFSSENTSLDGVKTVLRALVNYADSVTAYAGTHKTYKPYKAGYDYFTVKVDQNRDSKFVGEKDTDTYEDVNAYIKLPTTYSETGAPTKLLMVCHGAGKGVLTTDGTSYDWTSYDLYNNMIAQFVAEGYAVFDCNGIANAVYWCNFWGDLRGVSAWRKAYEYIVENYNVEEEFSIYGFSMGGLTAMALNNSGMKNIKCIALGSPVTSIEAIWNQGNNNGLLKHLYGFTDTTTYEPAKVVGSDPAYYIYNDAGTEKYSKEVASPVKVWFGTLEDQPSPIDAERLVNAMKNSGYDATFVPVTNGTHSICYGANQTVVSEIIEFINSYN